MNLEGIFIGHHMVLAPLYSTLPISFTALSKQGWQHLDVGTWIQFNAESPPDRLDFKVSDWKICPRKRPTVKVVKIGDKYIVSFLAPKLNLDWKYH